MSSLNELEKELNRLENVEECTLLNIDWEIRPRECKTLINELSQIRNHKAEIESNIMAMKGEGNNNVNKLKREG